MAARPNTPPIAEHGSENWMPGQYAECMHDAPWYSRGLAISHAGPEAGDIAKVRHVLVKRCALSGKLVEMLTFDRWPQKAYPSSKFRRAEKPKFSIRSITRVTRRSPHAAGVGVAAIVTAVCYGAAAVAQIFTGER